MSVGSISSSSASALQYTRRPQNGEKPQGPGGKEFEKLQTDIQSIVQNGGSGQDILAKIDQAQAEFKSSDAYKNLSQEEKDKITKLENSDQVKQMRAQLASGQMPTPPAGGAQGGASVGNASQETIQQLLEQLEESGKQTKYQVYQQLGGNTSTKTTGNTSSVESLLSNLSSATVSAE